MLSKIKKLWIFNLISHIAVIMDGNGRWALQRGLNRSEGHRAGAKTVRNIITRARQRELPFLTLYALSRENLERPKDELKQLFSLFVEFVSEEVPQLIEQGIRLNVIGDTSLLPFASQKALKYALHKTEHCDKMQLCLALAYSAREEIARAFQRMQAVEDKEKFSNLSTSDLADSISSYLDCPHFPDPDLIIRTGGDTRLSNFLLYQAAYSELYFSQNYFPDFTEEQFDKAIDDFYQRKRRFGKTDSQVLAGE